jgi:hypothetical protein
LGGLTFELLVSYTFKPVAVTYGLLSGELPTIFMAYLVLH